MKNKCLILLKAVLISSSILIAGCPRMRMEEMGILTFPDFLDSTEIIGQVAGSIDYGEVIAGEKVVYNLKISNTGTADFTITEMSFVNDRFRFVDNTAPDLPLIIPPGKTFDDIFLEFCPAAAGLQEGAFIVKSDIKKPQSFLLSGTGLWKLTLNVDALDRGSILKPIEVLQGETKEMTTALDNVELSAEPGFLFEFISWVVDSSEGDPPDFENDEAMVTTVTLKSHTEITADFDTPFRGVDPGDNINTAINDCVPDGFPDAVILSVGTHNVDYNIIMKSTIPIYGGFNAVLNPVITATDRKYKEPKYRDSSDPEGAAFATIINFTDTTSSIVCSGSSIAKDVLIEGFTIQRSSGSSTPLISCTSSATPIIRYNTIKGYGAGPALYCNNSNPDVKNNVISGGSGADTSTALRCYSASPWIEENILTGGNASGSYTKAYALKVEENSAPVIFKNTISGGNAPGTSGDAYGIFNDFECEPLIIGNTIDGGYASGSGGQSYGIYMVNNGNVRAGYNDISGGRGSSSAYSLYAYQGANLYLSTNNIFTEGGSDQYGIYLGTNGRLRKLINSALYDCDDAYIYIYLDPGNKCTTISEVNDYCHTDTNTGTRISITVPDDPYSVLSELE